MVKETLLPQNDRISQCFGKIKRTGVSFSTYIKSDIFFRCVECILICCGKMRVFFIFKIYTQPNADIFLAKTDISSQVGVPTQVQ